MGNYDLAILGGGQMISTYRGISLFGPDIVKALNGNYEIVCAYGEGLVLQPRSRDVPVSLGPRPRRSRRMTHFCSLKISHIENTILNFLPRAKFQPSLYGSSS
jgi:hypothetical protein